MLPQSPAGAVRRRSDRTKWQLKWSLWMSSRSVTQDLKALHIWGGGKPFSDANKMREGVWHILISTVGPLQYLTSNLCNSHSHPVGAELSFLFYR